MSDIINLLEQVKLIKRQVKHRMFWHHILPMLLVIYVIILPFFYFWILVKEWLGFLLLLFLMISVFIALGIRKIWLNSSFKEQISVYNRKLIPIKPEIKFIEFYLFVNEILKYPDIFNRRHEIISKIDRELISYIISIYEHKVTLSIFGLMLTIIGSSVTYIIQSTFPIRTEADVKNYLFITLIILIFLYIPWLISKDFLDRLVNKQDLREIKEFLEWSHVVKKNNTQA